ncbi:FecR domain-containing protein [Opitutus sp. GAS368]|uniref:FecR family protein n=1 Tax=Opitutus sp. GAS368 TaxID=1882749 RepID=UPI00087DB095|nr:FecR domain-containing protein [Opitutus sp. GAS368]SDS37604.1 FecR family protein [Opitutus sp. GAS368]
MMKPVHPTPTPSSGIATAQSIQRQAAEWLALRAARPLSPDEQAALAEWCAADPRHVAMLAEVDDAYQTFDRLAFYPRPPDGAVDPDLLVRRRGFAPVALAVAAAAAVALTALFWWQAPSSTVAPAPLVAAAPHFLRLPDGSRVELNSGSEVAEHFTATERRVRLVRGEAHFEVAKNPLRPFIVEANNISVRAVGTAFDVRLGATAVDVLVTEGKVGVTSASRPLAVSGEAHRDAATPAALGPGVILVAGQRTAVPTAPTPSTPPELVVENLSEPQIARALSWQSSRLVFDAMPLAEVVERFNRSAAGQDGPRAVHLQVRGTDLEGLRISGRIRYDSIENFVEVLEENFDVTAEHRGSEIILRRRR